MCFLLIARIIEGSREEEVADVRQVDLHAHSNCSDGSDTPARLAELAQAAGLAAFALTDHDTIAGVEEARAEAAERGVELLPGMELTVDFAGRQLHLVALGFRADSAAFQDMYREIRRCKENAMEEVVDRIRRMGADISLDKVLPYARTGGVDRYAIMRYFVATRAFDEVRGIWDTYINPALAGVGMNLKAEEGIAAIRAAGGVTSLAHYHKRIGLRGFSRAEQETAILRLVSMGLDGMERCYPTYAPEDAAFAAYLIDKYRLMSTGGTDYHGANRPRVALGTGIDGNTAVPYALYDGVRARLERR